MDLLGETEREREREREERFVSLATVSSVTKRVVWSFSPKRQLPITRTINKKCYTFCEEVVVLFFAALILYSITVLLFITFTK